MQVQNFSFLKKMVALTYNLFKDGYQEVKDACENSRFPAEFICNSVIVNNNIGLRTGKESKINGSLILQYSIAEEFFTKRLLNSEKCLDKDSVLKVLKDGEVEGETLSSMRKKIRLSLETTSKEMLDKVASDADLYTSNILHNSTYLNVDATSGIERMSSGVEDTKCILLRPRLILPDYSIFSKKVPKKEQSPSLRINENVAKTVLLDGYTFIINPAFYGSFGFKTMGYTGSRPTYEETGEVHLMQLHRHLKRMAITYRKLCEVLRIHLMNNKGCVYEAVLKKSIKKTVNIRSVENYAPMLKFLLSTGVLNYDHHGNVLQLAATSAMFSIFNEVLKKLQDPLSISDDLFNIAFEGLGTDKVGVIIGLTVQIFDKVYEDDATRCENFSHVGVLTITFGFDDISDFVKLYPREDANVCYFYDSKLPKGTFKTFTEFNGPEDLDTGLCVSSHSASPRSKALASKNSVNNKEKLKREQSITKRKKILLICSLSVLGAIILLSIYLVYK